MAVRQDPLVAGDTSFRQAPGRGGRDERCASRSLAPRHAEFVVARDPEVIIDTSMGTEQQSGAAAFWQRLPSLAAVRDGHVYARSDRICGRGRARWSADFAPRAPRYGGGQLPGRAARVNGALR
jgi:ABC-type Fe3+-hydroxamate transport system substrate-binding protein